MPSLLLSKLWLAAIFRLIRQSASGASRRRQFFTTRLLPASVVALLMLVEVGCSNDLTQAERALAAKGVFPDTFRSDIVAVAYMHWMPVGGHVESYKVGSAEVMVAYRHGSGLPVTGVAVYRRDLFRWTRESIGSAPPSDERFTVEVSERSLTFVGQRSQRRWLLYEFK